MIFKFRLGKFRFTFSFAPVIDVTGVNSSLGEGNHIAMWDFDGIPLFKVVKNLLKTQRHFKLPNIYLFQSSEGNNYIAYCFTKRKFLEVMKIIAYTDGVDFSFFKYGVYRERFTLRISEKNGFKPKLLTVLKSRYPEEASLPELKSFVKYETLAR